MATSKRKNNPKTRTTASSSGIGRNDKRQCTRSTTSTISVKREPEEEGMKKEHDNNVSNPPIAVSSNSNTEDDNLPTRIELSKELCRIVDTDTYSREVGFATLQKMSKWLQHQNLDFLKSFHVLGGVIRVLDFITTTMEDINCEGSIRSRCIAWGASVIASATFYGDKSDKKDTATKIIASIVDYDGVNTLINASEEFIGEAEDSQLAPLADVWSALRNIIALGSKIKEEQAIAVFETGIDGMHHLKNFDNALSNIGLEDIFATLRSLLRQGTWNTDYFLQNITTISKCLDVFKKNDGTWIDRGEAVTDWAMELFRRCSLQHLFVNGDSDYEMLLPFYAFALKQHAANKHVRNNAIAFFGLSCTAVHNKNIIKQSGVMESLAVFLGSNEIDDDKKKEVGVLIGKIAALV